MGNRLSTRIGLVLLLVVATGLITGTTVVNLDGDSTPIGFELFRTTDSLDRDTDNDGLTDTVELSGVTNPTVADTDGDKLDDGREQSLGTDPTVTNTDGDKFDDGREQSLGTDPTAADTDGDTLDDGREQSLGTDPADNDTDSDGLLDSRELKLGSEPTDFDTDNDTLLDGWEVRDEGPAGNSLPESDPLAMDLYVQFDYTNITEPKSEEFYDRVRREWSEMRVENPDGSTGINLHVREGGVVDTKIVFNGTNFDAVRQAYNDVNMGNRTSIYHHIVFVRFTEDVGKTGYAAAPGDFAIVATGRPNREQKNTVVHELLHNVMGTLDAEKACEGDPIHYCDDGWLSKYGIERIDRFLPLPLANEIERQGFAD